MSTWKGIIGIGHSPKEFDRYCHELVWNAWRPSFIVVHNTAIPTLAQRPNGFSSQHMKNLEIFYRDTQKWKSGPHLFIDDNLIWVFTPLNVSGTHSPSWNKVSLGIEMLGNYDKESFTKGRGLKVQKNTIAALATITGILGLDPNTIKLHREDPLTTHACPGKTVRKLELIQQVQDLLISRHAGEHPIKPVA